MFRQTIGLKSKYMFVFHLLDNKQSTKINLISRLKQYKQQQNKYLNGKIIMKNYKQRQKYQLNDKLIIKPKQNKIIEFYKSDSSLNFKIKLLLLLSFYYSQMFKKEQGKQIVQQHIETQKIVKRYIKGNLLGKGGFAKCYQFISQQTNRKYAAKIIQKSSLNKPKAKQKLQSQIKIHKSLHHQHVVNFEHFFEDQQYVYILLQICRPETLNDLLKRRKRITQFEIKYYIHQIVQALKYIHGKKVIHRDLKLGNLFLTDQLNIKVGDFGLATKLTYDQQRKKTTCGTPNYLAPEILTNKNGHSYEVDIWSIGVIAYALLFGRPPFQTNDLKLTYSKIKSCNYAFPDIVNASSSIKRFITKILQLQPHKRPNLDQILQDQFMSSIQIPKGLPLATISIPLSANFMKKYQKQSFQKKMVEQKSLQQSNENIKSHRTLQRNKVMMSTDKLQTSQKKYLLKKQSSRQNLVIQRAASTAGLLQRKKTSVSFKQKNVNKQTLKGSIPIRVIYFQQNPKFGISYMLSTNAFGMRYNDSTCIVTNSILSKIRYFTMQSNLKQLSSQTYPYNQTPSQINKKVKIINHYVKQLNKKKNQLQQKISNQLRIQLQKMKSKQTPQNSMGIYVIRSLKTSKAQFFQFNNLTVQVIFQDSSQVIFKNINPPSRPGQQIVAYITKFYQLKQFDYNKLEQQSEDVKKRMNYALNVIGRVKKTLQTKQNPVKYIDNKQLQNGQNQNCQNRNFPLKSLNQSVEKQKSGLGRSSSTMRLGYQNSLSKENSKHFNSTAKLSTLNNTNKLNGITNLRQNILKMHGSHPLKQISNNIF